MGVTPNLKTETPVVGDVVTVRQGKHKALSFVVVKVEGERAVYIADGKNYPVEKPKKKNVLHLQRTRINLEEVAERVAGGKPLDNGWLVLRMTAVLRNGDTSCRQGG